MLHFSCGIYITQCSCRWSHRWIRVFDIGKGFAGTSNKLVVKYREGIHWSLHLEDCYVLVTHISNLVLKCNVRLSAISWNQSYWPWAWNSNVVWCVFVCVFKPYCFFPLSNILWVHFGIKGPCGELSFSQLPQWLHSTPPGSQTVRIFAV